MLKTKKIITILIVMTLMTVNLITANAESSVIDNNSYDELWLQEIIEYETEMGNIVDKISGTDNLYLTLALSNLESDREIFVYHVMDIYDKLTKEQKSKIDGYLVGYADGVDDQNVREFVKEKNNTLSLMRVSYDWEAARDYAYTYYKNYNFDKYPSLNNIDTTTAGDCANFVSQCLYKGGKRMDNEWYIRKLNDDNPEPTTIDELNESWDLASPSPWISAKQFGIYWSGKARNTATYSVSDYLALTDHSISGYAIGDAVQVTKKAIVNYYGHHTMLITRISGNDFLYSAHYVDRKDSNLTTALGAYNSSSYKVKFFAMY